MAQNSLLALFTIGGMFFITVALLVSPPVQPFQTFFSYFINTLPFLVFGVLVAAIINQYLTSQALTTYAPTSLRTGILVAALLGLAFPFGEVGIIPIAWVLQKKGLPAYLVITLLFSAPAVNPITFLATSLSIGFGWALLQVTGSLFIALLAGTFVYRTSTRIAFWENGLLPQSADRGHRLWGIITHAGELLFKFLPFFIAGCLLAAGWDELSLLNTHTNFLHSIPLALFSAHHPLTDHIVVTNLLTGTSIGSAAVYLLLGTSFGLPTTTTLVPLLKFRPLVTLLTIATLITAIFGFVVNLIG